MVCSGINYSDDNYEIYGEIEMIRGTQNSSAATGAEPSSQEQSKTVAKIVGRGKSIVSARNDLDTRSDFPLFLGAVETIIFSESYAKKGVEEYLNRTEGSYEYNKISKVVVSRDPLDKLFDMTPTNNLSLGYSIRDLMIQMAEKGQTVVTDINRSLDSMITGKEGYLLNYIGMEETGVNILGLAVMKNSKMVGVIPIEETPWVASIIAKKPVNNTLEVPHPQHKDDIIAATIQQKRRKITADYRNGRLYIDISIGLEAKVPYQSHFQKISDHDKKQIEDEISKIYQNGINTVIKKAQEEYKCDFLNLFQSFRIKNPEMAKKIDWEKEFQRAQVNVNAKTKIISFELMDVEQK